MPRAALKRRRDQAYAFTLRSPRVLLLFLSQFCGNRCSAAPALCRYTQPLYTLNRDVFTYWRCC